MWRDVTNFHISTHVRLAGSHRPPDIRVARISDIAASTGAIPRTLSFNEACPPFEVKAHPFPVRGLPCLALPWARIGRGRLGHGGCPGLGLRRLTRVATWAICHGTLVGGIQLLDAKTNGATVNRRPRPRSPHPMRLVWIKGSWHETEALGTSQPCMRNEPQRRRSAGQNTRGGFTTVTPTAWHLHTSAVHFLIGMLRTYS